MTWAWSDRRWRWGKTNARWQFLSNGDKELSLFSECDVCIFRSFRLGAMPYFAVIVCVCVWKWLHRLQYGEWILEHTNGIGKTIQVTLVWSSQEMTFRWSENVDSNGDEKRGEFRDIVYFFLIVCRTCEKRGSRRTFRFLLWTVGQMISPPTKMKGTW